jgi:hypothetical protein
MMKMSKGWDFASKLRPQTGLLFMPTWYVSMGNYGGMISTGGNSWFVHHSCLKILPPEPSSRDAGGTCEWNEACGLTKYLCSYFEGICNMP